MNDHLVIAHLREAIEVTNRVLIVVEHCDLHGRENTRGSARRAGSKPSESIVTMALCCS
jgi:hypothetical protein